MNAKLVSAILCLEKELFMKRLLMLSAVVLVFLVVLSGCENGQGQGQRIGTTAQTPELTESGERSEVEAFVPPADLFNLNLRTDDPSNDDIHFDFDNEGRISRVVYSIDDYRVVLSYSYDDLTVQIFGFIDSIVVADVQLVASSGFDDTLGFIEYRGYYFFGFNFS